MEHKDTHICNRDPHDSIAQQLMKSFMRLRRVDWRQQNPIDGCKPSEVTMLFCIKRNVKPDAPLKVSEISRLLHVTSPTVTQLINGLESNGLVERKVDPADRRAVSIKLTEQGERITQIASNALLNSYNGLVNHLGEEQSRTLVELLSQAFVYFSETKPNDA